MGSPIDDVAARLRAIEQRLPNGDGLRTFTAIYRQVTELVGTRVVDQSFVDPLFVERLDVVFADLFFEAERAAATGQRASAAWQPLVDARRTPGLLPIQYAIAGMNAHINNDLALAVVRTCAALGRDPHSPGVRADYERVNDVLAEVVRPIRQSFLDEAVVKAGSNISPVVDVVSMWSIDKARDAAWTSALALWELRGVPWLADRLAQTLAGTVGLVTRSLLVPLSARP